MATILAIEDTESVRNEVSCVLRFEGYDVVEAENGRVGMEHVARHTPDLILCDLMMPEVDGYEVLRRVRDDPQYAAIPFVCLTARTERSDIERVMQAGASDYITKPFTIDGLLQVIRSLLAREAARKMK